MNIFEAVLYKASLAEQAKRDAPDAAEEAVDVIVTVLGLARVAGCSAEQLSAAVDAVIAKNDAKTDETHYLCPDTGKIRRR